MRRTKIVCTMGPASDSSEVIRGMIEAGMDVARINFAHGTHEEHAKIVKEIRNIASELDHNVAILGDLSGSKIRTGTLAKEPIILKPGDPFRLTIEPVIGDWQQVSVNFKGLPQFIKPGDTLLLNDGTIHLAVESVSPQDVMTRIRVGGELRSHKGISSPGREVLIDTLTAKDQEDTAFAVAHGFDWLALSFVRTPEDIRRVRQWIANCGGYIPIIAKIEKREAIDALEEILHEADGVMVARGDLGVEVSFEEVPFLQMEIISKALSRHVPVITATQMLESMIDRPRPTRAEVTDIATAVLQGTDAVMLSEETAIGRYPQEALETMSRIAARAERDLDHSRFLGPPNLDQSVAEAVGRTACTLATAVGARAILVPTWKGTTPLVVASHRPSQPVIVFCQDRTIQQRLALGWGIIPLLVDRATNIDETVKVSVQEARARGWLKSGDLAILLGNIPLDDLSTSNFLQVLQVS